jgi:hypothetical protein
MRCRNFMREAFIDYVITRIADAKISDSEPQEHEIREADIQWNRIVEMELVAHPEQSKLLSSPIQFYGWIKGENRLRKNILDRLGEGLGEEPRSPTSTMAAIEQIM